jgi:glyoxylase-like metal-dependent hydrolase (beta-lactamase superfamily II)
VSQRVGPQVLPGFFQHGDAREAILALADLDADLILPGHGDPLRMQLAEAVEIARGGD